MSKQLGRIPGTYPDPLRLSAEANAKLGEYDMTFNRRVIAVTDKGRVYVNRIKAESHGKKAEVLGYGCPLDQMQVALDELVKQL